MTSPPWQPTDAVIKLTAACVCGSDFWPYCGADDTAEPPAMATGIWASFEEISADVKNFQEGQFVVGSCFASANTCEMRHSGLSERLRPAPRCGGAPEYLRVPLADAWFRRCLPPPDVLGIRCQGSPGRRGKTVAVVGDGAV